MKRILSLDGGGIRGIFTLQILARVETLLREHQQKPGLVLADVFDLIAGTSTGAIIATALSWGLPVKDIEQLYILHGKRMFSPVPWYGRWKSKYQAESLAKFFREFFTEADGTVALLGSKRLRTLLLTILRNASTGSPWPISNNPHARFNDPALAESNLNIPLWQLLRATTAAPTYFPPEEIALGSQKHMFVDGGITPFNNPALIAVMMATLPPYRLQWPANRQELHVLSIGTTLSRVKLPAKLARKINFLDQIKFITPALVTSVSVQQDILCRIMGDCVHGHDLDTELGALDAATLLTPAEQKFSYCRYDTALDAGIPLDDLKIIPQLQELGRRYAEENVRVGHFFPR